MSLIECLRAQTKVLQATELAILLEVTPQHRLGTHDLTAHNVIAVNASHCIAGIHH